jgi:hypothetical protein
MQGKVGIWRLGFDVVGFLAGIKGEGGKRRLVELELGNQGRVRKGVEIGEG